MSELMSLSAVERAALVRSGEVSAIELVEAVIARIADTRELNAGDAVGGTAA